MGRLDIVASLGNSSPATPTPRNLRDGEANIALPVHSEAERFAAAALRRNLLWAKASRRSGVYPIELTVPKELGFHGRRVKDSAERGDLTQTEFCS
jgi:hypothetical protein